MSIDQLTDLGVQLNRLIKDFSMQEAEDRTEIVRAMQEMLEAELDADKPFIA